MSRVASCPHCGGSLILMKSGESPALTARPESQAQDVKLATCKRCGEGGLVWAKSYKTGKSYLCKVDANGKCVAKGVSPVPDKRPGQRGPF